MGEALAEAQLAATRGERPIAAVAVVNEAMVARAHDRVLETNDPTAHAVIVALREAARKLGTERLADATIFATLEPCPMCVGALLESDVEALVFAVPNAVDGAAGHGPPARPEPEPRTADPRRQRHPARGGRGALRRRPRPRRAERSPRFRSLTRPRPPTARPDPFARLAGGEVSEWLMVPLSKSGLRKQRGFESHPLRQLLAPDASCVRWPSASRRSRRPSALAAVRWPRRGRLVA